MLPQADKVEKVVSKTSSRVMFFTLTKFYCSIAKSMTLLLKIEANIESIHLFMHFG